MICQLQYKEAEGSSYREGSYSETPGTPPKVSETFISPVVREVVCDGL